MSATDIRFMKMALALGRRGLGRVWPNPAVGCVIVRDGRVVGRGWTKPGGRPHAETVAIAQAAAQAAGATAYVTLEPCSHHGKTAPCAKALIDAGLTRVVVATRDPNPLVAGQGLEMLRTAGIRVDLGLLEIEACQDLAGFLKTINHQMPMVTLKLANSFDGRIATATGESQWITGPRARRAVHMMRMCHDAVLVGGGTARSDDPSLTVRDMGAQHQPIRLIWSRKLDLPLQSQLGRSARDIPVWICHGKEAAQDRQSDWANAGAKLFSVDSGPDGHIDPAKALNALAQAGLTRIFCEGGGALAASLLQADLVDQLIGFTAGVALGAEGLPGIGAMGLEKLSDAPRFRLVDTQAVGGDVMHRWVR